MNSFGGVGCELPPAVLTEREWEREQRKLTAPSMAGRGGGRGGGFSSGRGNAAGGRGGYAARYPYLTFCAIICIWHGLCTTADLFH